MTHMQLWVVLLYVHRTVCHDHCIVRAAYGLYVCFPFSLVLCPCFSLPSLYRGSCDSLSLGLALIALSRVVGVLLS